MENSNTFETRSMWRITLESFKKVGFGENVSWKMGFNTLLTTLFLDADEAR